MTCETNGLNSQSSDIDFWAVARDLFRMGKRVTLKPLGGSMKPFIWPGDTVDIDPSQDCTLKFGDIVLYKTSVKKDRAATIIHRVVKIYHENGEPRIVTRGDASSKMDDPVTSEQVLGKVTAIQKGKLTLRLDRPVGKAINRAWSLFQCFPISFHAFLAARKLLRPLHRGRCFLR